MAEEFKPIETAEAFEAAVQSRLAEAAKQYEGYLSPDDAKKQKDDYDKQLQALSEKVTGHEATISALTAKNTAHEQRALKQKIAHETGIPFELADKLSGDTEEALRADAQVLARFAARSQDTPRYSAEKNVTDTRAAALLDLLHDYNH